MGRAVTMHDPSILGAFSKKVGNSLECLVLVYSFSRDTLSKKIITISTTDSSCLKKLEGININVDSTKHFIIRKDLKPLG